MIRIVAIALTAVLAVGCTTTRSTTQAPVPTQVAETDEHAWRKDPPKPGKPASIHFPTPTVQRLSNGMQVLVVKRPATTVTLIAITRHGGSSVPNGKSGLAALTTRLMTEGTAQKTNLELAEAVESLGTTLSHDTGRDYAELSLTVLPEDAGRGLELLVEIVREPAFRNNVFTRVKEQWLDHLRAERQDPRRLASLVGLRRLLGHDQGAPVGGSIPHVRAITRTDVVAFHHAAFTPQATSLVVVGNIDPAQIRAQLESLVDKWTGGPPLGTPGAKPVSPINKTRIVTVDRPGAQQTSLFVAQPYPKRSVAGHEAREILNGVVGGLFTSRLNQNLREKHAFTYGARSSTIATRHFGAFVVMTSVKTDVTGRALRELFSELDHVNNPMLGRPITQVELSRSRSDLIHSLGAMLEHTDDIADAVSDSVIRDLPPDYLSRYASIVRDVRLETVVEQARTYLKPKRLLVVAVGDLKRIEPDLLKLQVELVPAQPEDLQ